MSHLGSSVSGGASLIQRVIHCAKRTFGRSGGGGGGSGRRRSRLSADEFQRHLTELHRLLNRLTLQDLGLEHSAALTGQDTSAPSATPVSPAAHPPSSAPPPKVAAPVTYIDIYESQDLSVGIFIVRPGCRIPLHNHPNMHGIVKCLSGSLAVTAYTHLSEPETRQVRVPDALMNQTSLLKRGHIFPVKRRALRNIGPNSDISCLTADEWNYHEIEPEGAKPMAFLDVLAPPYAPEAEDESERRDCDFFRVLPYTSANSSISWLQWTVAPKDFFCDSEPYRGPSVA